MNPIQRKAKTVEMTKSTDHRDVSGGLGRRLRRPRLLPYVALVAVVAAIPVAAGSAAGPVPAQAGRAEDLQAPRWRTLRRLASNGSPAPFTRTPSFAWAPVRGAKRYEFELSTSKYFRAENAVIWSSKTLTTPAAAVPISLPWITGPSLYWHVRALAGDRVSRWSDTGRFSMRWTSGVPQQLPSEPGFVSWTPIEGATGYDVWFGNLGKDQRDGHEFSVGKVFSTITTVADEREYSTLRSPGQDVVWRVRARRQLYGSTNNGLPRVSYGPWSSIRPAYSEPAGVADASAQLHTVSSDATSWGKAARATQDHAGLRLAQRRVQVPPRLRRHGQRLREHRSRRFDRWRHGLRAQNHRPSRPLPGEVERQERSLLPHRRDRGRRHAAL